MRDEIDLEVTRAVIGELLPALVNKRGEIIDGRHRLKMNAKWRRVELDLDELKTHAARLVINTQRRIASDEDYDEFAEYLRKTEPGEEDYTVKSGQTIVERICEITGIPERTVRYHLNAAFKAATVATSSASDFERVEVGVPEPIADTLKEAVAGLRALLEEHPDQTQQIVEGFNEHVGNAPLMSAPVDGRARKKEKTATKTSDEFDATDFLKSMSKWSTASTTIRLPTEVMIRAVKSMDGQTRERFLVFARVILNAAEQLQRIVEQFREVA